MKRLWFFRHSIKDGPHNTLGPKGLALALEVSKWIYGTGAIGYFAGPKGGLGACKVFTGVSARTIQTALVFTRIFPHTTTLNPTIMPAIEEFGTDEFFAPMLAHPDFRNKAKQLGNYAALLICHDKSKVRTWAGHCAEGVRKAFDSLGDAEGGVAFGHSPAIELAVAGIADTLNLKDEFASLKEMEAILFEEVGGEIHPVRKITMPTPEPTA